MRNTDRALARLVGGVLAAERAGSALMVDAHAVAAAVESGGGIVLTADTTDVDRLAAPYGNVQVVNIGWGCAVLPPLGIDRHQSVFPQASA